MANGYNETSDYYANKNYRNSDVNLAEDANNLGGIPADEYALKTWVNKVFENYVKQFNINITTSNSNLEKVLKAYIEASIRTQANTDANTYAKKTDLTALEDNLKKELKQYADNVGNNSNSSTDSKISTLKSEINSNLTTLNNYVNEKYQELFQYVSNGKTKVAGAITDKGVSTSATDTFETMATNISKIKSGSSGGADLSQASPLIPDNIAYGKKAFGSNGLITGTHKDSGGGTEYPTYGTDTSDATATASDILKGKVAYSQGVRLTGTLEQVEEIHKNNFNTIETERLNITPTFQDDGVTYKLIGYYFSKDGKSLIRIGQNTSSTTDIKIFSNAFLNNQIVVMASAGSEGSVVYKKYKYSLSELGITNYIAGVSITCGGVKGNNNLAYLIILESSGSGTEADILHIYPYHLSDNRQIGPLTGEEVTNLTLDLDEYKYVKNAITTYYPRHWC